MSKRNAGKNYGYTEGRSVAIKRSKKIQSGKIGKCDGANTFFFKHFTRIFYSNNFYWWKYINGNMLVFIIYLLLFLNVLHWNFH